MFAQITKDLEVNWLSCDFTKESQMGSSHFVLFGKLSGIYTDKGFLSPEESWNLICDCRENSQSLENLLTQSTGIFILARILKGKQISLYVPPEGPGFFYAKKDETIIAVQDERTFYEQVKENGIHDFEALRMITNHVGRRALFSTLFKNTFRCLGGQVLEFKKDWVPKIRFYLPWKTYGTEQRSTKELDLEFKKILEDMTAHTFDHLHKTRNYVQISGGIDSTIVLIAAKAAGLPITALHHYKEPFLLECVKKLCETIDVPLKVVGRSVLDNPSQWWEDYATTPNELYERYRGGLGILAFDNIFFLKDYFDDELFSMGGHAIGQIYQVYPSVFPCFGMNKIKIFIKEFFIFKPKRFLFSLFWLSNFQNPVIRFLVKLLLPKSMKLPRNQWEFLSFLTLSLEYPMIPKKGLLPRELKHLEKEYTDYFTENSLLPVLGEEKLQALKQGTPLKDLELQQMTRLLGLVITQTHARRTWQSAKIGGYQHVDPPVLGPMVDFLMRLPIKARAVRYPKELEFNYFKNILGIDYHEDFIKSTIKDNIAIDSLKTLIRITRRALGKSRTLTWAQAVSQTKEYKNYLLSKIDPNNSVLLNQIQDSAIKKYLVDLYEGIKSGRVDNYIIANQICNIEVLLKGLYGDEG